MLTSLAGGKLLAEKTGRSPATVVALHGWARTGADFADIVEGLDAVAIHLPGFGVTPEPPEPWGSAEYADVVAEALRGGPPVVLLGHSFGGRVAVRLAARYPELVSCLVLTGVPLVRLVPAPTPSLAFRAVRWLANHGVIPKEALEKRRRRLGSADYLAARGVMRDILVRVIREDYRAELSVIEAPVRMVWGELDTAAPADAGLAASKLLANSSFRVVPGAGHLLEGPLETAVREELLAAVAEAKE